MNTNCEFCGSALDITCDPLYSSESCLNCGYYYHEDGNIETLIPPQLNVNALCTIDSGMGGVFTLKYLGRKNGKHHFENTSKGWESYSFNLKDDEIYSRIKKSTNSKI